ncbi:S1C family serine protease [Qipengyuania algicida]|nr:trypsin-like peptidase domain-containing protein [Qipengyuania algicida]
MRVESFYSVSHGRFLSAACSTPSTAGRIPALAVNVMGKLKAAAMLRIARLLAVAFALLSASLLRADPSDIDAAARGVVRVVIVSTNQDGVSPVGHGTGFAVTPDTIVTNAHVVRDAAQDDALKIAIVPSDGGRAVYGQILAFSPRNDLALISISSAIHLPPLAIAGGPPPDAGEVTAVGYPLNVDRAQGLSLADIIQSQPPVKSHGYLSGTRPSRQFDTLLHTAPIGRGNSGGPLLDACGRVLGVNSFGADSSSSDAEFFFAVSDKELIPFLRDNGIDARINSSPCRSMADLNAQERARAQQEQIDARVALEGRNEAERAKRDRAQFVAEMKVRDERDDRMLASVLLLLIAAGLGWWAYEKRPRTTADGEPAPLPQPNKIAFAGAGVSVALVLFLQITRPGIDEIDRRVTAAMAPEAKTGSGQDEVSLDGHKGTRRYLCHIDQQRSRVTTSRTDDLDFTWNATGCVNGRTQYGFANGSWQRVLVPNEDQEVSVNSFDPDRREFRVERYPLSNEAMQAARAARGKYSAPECGGNAAAAKLGDQQAGVLSALPSQPNERLVYSCDVVGEDGQPAKAGPTP